MFVQAVAECSRKALRGKEFEIHFGSARDSTNDVVDSTFERCSFQKLPKTINIVQKALAILSIITETGLGHLDNDMQVRTGSVHRRESKPALEALERLKEIDQSERSTRFVMK